jgi:hypothetical protein
MFHPPRIRPIRSYLSSVALEQENVWIGFYRRVSDPAVAAQVIAHLNGDPDLKRTHTALYLSCTESLRKAKARAARRKRVRGMLRRILRALVPGSKARRRAALPHAGRLPPEAIPPIHGRNEPMMVAAQEPHFEAASHRCAKAA